MCEMDKLLGLFDVTRHIRYSFFQVFATGAGTQVMLTKSSSPARGIMNEVARSLLTVQELSSFKYYINEYEQRRVSVEDLAQALLELLNTKEKVRNRRSREEEEAEEKVK